MPANSRWDLIRVIKGLTTTTQNLNDLRKNNIFWVISCFPPTVSLLLLDYSWVFTWFRPPTPPPPPLIGSLTPSPTSLFLCIGPGKHQPAGWPYNSLRTPLRVALVYICRKKGEVKQLMADIYKQQGAPKVRLNDNLAGHTEQGKTQRMIGLLCAVFNP